MLRFKRKIRVTRYLNWYFAPLVKQSLMSGLLGLGYEKQLHPLIPVIRNSKFQSKFKNKLYSKSNSFSYPTWGAILLYHSRYRSQLSISTTFYKQLVCRLPFAEKLQTLTVSTEKLHKTLSYENAAHKMLLKSNPVYKGFNWFKFFKIYIQRLIHSLCPILLYNSWHQSLFVKGLIALFDSWE